MTGGEWSADFADSRRFVGAGHQPCDFVAVVNDITARRQSEEEARAARDEAQRRAHEAEQRERMLAAMMEHIPMGITIADAPDVRIRAVSRHGRELVGRPREQIEDITAEKHVDRWRVFQADGVTPAEDDQLPLTRAVQHGEVVREEEWVLQRSDGRRVPILCNAAPIMDEAGQITGGVIGWQDITSRREAEQALRESEERFRDIFENAAAGIALTAADGRLMRVNRCFADMLGYEPAELEGISYEQITHPDDLPLARERFEQLLAGSTDSYAMRKRYLRKDGGVVWVQLSMAARRDGQGAVRHVIRAVQDITAQVEAEQQLQEANATLEARVTRRTQVIREQSEQVRALSLEVIEAEERERKRIAAVLHDELQQLLAAARMRLSMLRGRVPDEHQDRWRDIDQLMDESIAAARSLAVELSPPILRDAGLAAALRWLAKRFDEQYELKVHVDACQSDEPREEEMRSLLFRAARELLFNVVKHAETGEAWVTLDSGSGATRLVVRDEGRGCASVSGGEGSGLGLFALVQRVERLAGRCDVQTAPGAGCRVTLTVPQDGRPESVDEAIAAASADESERTRGDAVDGTDRLRVVIVDDHRLMREGLASLLLEQPDVEVVGQAGDGREALEVVRRARPDVVLMDVTLPDIDGIEATRRLKAEHGDLRIVGLSMHDSSEMVSAMCEAGASAYVLKGGPSDPLLEAIRG